MKELALLNKLYRPISCSLSIVNLQFLYLPWKKKIINIILYLITIAAYCMITKYRINDVIQFILIIICIGFFVIVDGFFFRIAFKDYFKKFSLELDFFEIKANYIRYLIFRDRAINKGYYNISFVKRALERLKIESPEFYSNSTIARDLAMAVLSCLITELFNKYNFLQSKIAMCILIYILLKLSIFIYCSYNSKRKKQELNQFLSRLKNELTNANKKNNKRNSKRIVKSLVRLQTLEVVDAI